MNEQFDAIILGAGQAGGPLSTTLACAGWKVALVEANHVGGTCVNEGCTPTKTMIASARVAHLVSRASEYGVELPAYTINLEKVRERKRNIVQGFRKGSTKRVQRAENVELIYGTGRFVSEHEIEVALNDGNTRLITGRNIFINTGTRTRIPTINGLDNVSYLTSTSIMELDKVPSELIVLGGGYIGLEFGQMFQRFGSQVTVVDHNDRLIKREDEDVSLEVLKFLKAEGMQFHLGAKTLHVEQDPDGYVRLTIKTETGSRIIVGSHLLLAIGRQPNSEELTLEMAGLEATERGFIPVNEKLQTAVPHIYALGDVNGGPPFTHIAYDDYRVVRHNLLGIGEKRLAGRNGRYTPYTLFTDPQMARVGLSEQQAKAQGIPYKLAKLNMTSVARALETAETRGFMKALVDPKTELILGATVIGTEGGEIMTVLQMAMMGNVPYTAIRDGVFAHPTFSESLNNLFMAMEDQPECKKNV